MELPRIGVVMLPELRWREDRHRWRRVEQLGFAHGWTYDHLAWRSLADGPWLATVPQLTAAATVTTRIELGTLVLSPNFRHPVTTAKELMGLDDISEGRLLLGLGAGGTGVDATVLGGQVLAPKQRMDRLVEFARALDALLRQDRTDFRGEHYTAVDARMMPGCIQQPRVPFVMAADGPRGLRLAAELGQGWVTTGGERAQEDAWWERVGELAERFDELVAPRDDPPRRFLSLDAAPGVALSSSERFRDMHGRAAELGFTDVVIHYPRAEGVYAASESVLEEIAPG